MSFLGFHLFSSDFLFSNCLLNGGRSNGIPHFGAEVTSVGNYLANHSPEKTPGKDLESKSGKPWTLVRKSEWPWQN